MIVIVVDKESKKARKGLLSFQIVEGRGGELTIW